MPSAAWVYNGHNLPHQGGRGAPCAGSRNHSGPFCNKGPEFDRGRDRDRRRDNDRDRRRDNNDSGDGGGGFSYWGGPYSYYPYGPDYRMDYSVNTPSRQSNSPYQIALNDGIHLSPLDSGYPGPAPSIGEYSYPAPFAPVPPAPIMAPEATSPDVDLVVGVQRQLRRLGYYRGMVNGISDGKTRTAIRAYEANMGLPVTGVMGAGLIRSLGIF